MLGGWISEAKAEAGGRTEEGQWFAWGLGSQLCLGAGASKGLAFPQAWAAAD